MLVSAGQVWSTFGRQLYAYERYSEFPLGTYVEFISFLGVFVALVISYRQNALTSRAIRAQSFVQLLDLEIQSHFQEGIVANSQLPKYPTYAEFDAQETPRTKQAIYDAVVFLNSMAVLGEESYLHVQDAWDVYFWSYGICREKLLPWWLAAQRVGQPNVFPSFERACNVTALVSDAQIAAFDTRIGLKYLKLYQHTSRVPEEKLRTMLSSQIQPLPHLDPRLRARLAPPCLGCASVGRSAQPGSSCVCRRSLVPKTSQGSSKRAHSATACGGHRGSDEKAGRQG